MGELEDSLLERDGELEAAREAARTRERQLQQELVAAQDRAAEAEAAATELRAALAAAEGQYGGPMTPGDADSWGATSSSAVEQSRTPDSVSQAGWLPGLRLRKGCMDVDVWQRGGAWTAMLWLTRHPQ